MGEKQQSWLIARLTTCTQSDFVCCQYFLFNVKLHYSSKILHTLFSHEYIPLTESLGFNILQECFYNLNLTPFQNDKSIGWLDKGIGWLIQISMGNSSPPCSLAFIALLRLAGQNAAVTLKAQGVNKRQLLKMQLSCGLDYCIAFCLRLPLKTLWTVRMLLDSHYLD